MNSNSKTSWQAYHRDRWYDVSPWCAMFMHALGYRVRLGDTA